MIAGVIRQRTLDDGRNLCVMPLLLGQGRLTLGFGEHGYDVGYCFETLGDAIDAFDHFREGEEPRGWRRCIQQGQPIRRRAGDVDDTYELIEDGRGQSTGECDAIKCLVCGMVSYNPHDVEQKYCGSCHQFHEFLKLPRGGNRG